RGFLISLFSADPEIIALGSGIMILAAFNQPFQSSFQIFAGALRGAGDSLYPAISMAIGILGVRPLFAYFLGHAFSLGLFGAWLALSADILVRFTFIAVRYRRGKWVHTTV
ncbi:MAG TPA: MATE family efflux transporter, partial [Spirochaetaceae bacterium]|nr:MATE family efflux transporter [Spirochaetaceae bacterium]